MVFVDKKYKAYECLMNYIKGKDTKEYQQFADLLIPMLYKKNNCSIFISVGNKKSNVFIAWLSTKLDSFIVTLGIFDNIPQLTIKDKNGLNVFTINFNLISDLNIDIAENPDSYYYNVSFKYDNIIDYNIKTVLQK